MSVKSCLEHLSMKVRLEGSQLVVTCPACGREGKCYVTTDTGQWQCFVCSEKGNLWTMIRLCNPDVTPSGIAKILKQFNMDTPQEKTKQEPKDLSWLRGKLRKADDADIKRLASAKKLASQAIKMFGPWRLKTEPIMFFPAYVPGNKKAVGFLRCHLDGKLITTKIGDKMYPILGTWGILGMHEAMKYNTLLFAEGFGDALKAIECGYIAVASSGGTGWKDEWRPIFKGKDVVIVPDADKPGMESAMLRKNKLLGIAKRVKVVTLPYGIKKKSGLDLRDFLS